MKPALLVLLALPAFAANRDPVFDGTWTGTLRVAARYDSLARENSARTEFPVVVNLRGDRAQVEIGEAGRIGTRLDDGFGRIVGLPNGRHSGTQVEKHDAAAVIYAADTSGPLIQTWQMSLTKTEADKVLVFYWLVQNLTQSGTEHGDGKIALGLVGELTRADDD
jgi:hypothetical protein